MQSVTARRIIVSLALLLALLALFPAAPLKNAAAPLFGNPSGVSVGMLKSRKNIENLGEKGIHDFDAACRLVGDLGLHCAVLDEDELLASGDALHRCAIIVLPNVRCLRPATAELLRHYAASGGKLLVTYLSSYRDEKNEKVGGSNDFQLAGVMKVHSLRWVSGRPHAEYLSLAAPGDDVRLAEAFEALPPSLQLGRNSAMLVRADEGARVLATWLDSSGKAPGNGGGSPAIVQSPDGGSIYVGEDIFCVENSQSAEVKRLAAALFNLLVEGSVPAIPQEALSRPPLFFPPMSPLSAPPAGGPLVRIGVATALREAHISCSSRYRITPRGGDGAVEEGGAVARITIEKSRLAAVSVRGGTAACSGEVIDITPVEKSSFIGLIVLKPNGTFSSTLMRGSLEVRVAAAGLVLIDSLPVDQYVAGVVPREVPLTYPPEALKAMAVIARTFALANLSRHGRDSFHLCPTVHCQVFEGVAAESPQTTKAVADTAGEVALYKGKPANTTFHACCGGVGENVERVWASGSAPYLAGSIDAPDAPALELAEDADFLAFLDAPPQCFCASSGRFRWKETCTVAELEKLLKASLPVLLKEKYRDFGTLVDIDVAERSPLGRVMRLTIKGSAKTLSLEKDGIRWMVSAGRAGSAGLNSTLFAIEKIGEGADRIYVLRGGGWGHGVGLCQEGAKGRALSGSDYGAIIRHYYPGVTVVKKF